MAEDLVGLTARQIAERVHTGEASPRQVVEAHLARIERVDPKVNAFLVVLGEQALADADALAARGGLTGFPLAGVPIAIKDNVDVEGVPTREGSVATPDAPAAADAEVVRRLREAGAIVVGKTTLPELAIWGTTDGAWGVTRNPWDLDRVPGGSSGGSAAAVASAMVPVAHGNDGLGSIRIPSACCGLFGIKAGADTIPAATRGSHWLGMSQEGALATTVADAALTFSVMAGRPELAVIEPPADPLRVAISTKSPVPGTRLNKEYRAAVTATGELLAGAGHAVEEADPPYSIEFATKVLARWFAGTAEEAEGLPPELLQRRTRSHARRARGLARARAKPDDRERFRARLAPFFDRFDLLVMPALAQPPIKAEPWSKRGWLANIWANARYAPYANVWNLAAYPAAAIPAGMHSTGVPLSVQLVARDGGEATVLSVAAQLEALRPWTRHAPLDAPAARPTGST